MMASHFRATLILRQCYYVMIYLLILQGFTFLLTSLAKIEINLISTCWSAIRKFTCDLTFHLSKNLSK